MQILEAQGHQSSLLDEVRPEGVLLLYGARTRLDHEATEHIERLAAAALDWDDLLKLARYHLVGPLLHRSLNEAVPEAVPPAVKEHLRAGLHANVYNSLSLAHELLALLRHFEEEGVPVVPFKGPVAAVMAYGDLRHRPFADLDILVHRQDVQRARALLTRLQFEPCSPLSPIFDKPRAWYRVWQDPLGKGMGYVRDQGQEEQVPVELHWGLAPRFFGFPLDPDTLWDRLQPVSVLEHPVFTFSPEDTLLHFCVHGTVHRWNKLRLVCDVAELVRSHPQLDWVWTLQQARALRSERMLFLSLYLARHLLGAPLPEQVVQQMEEDPAVRRLAEQAVAGLFYRAADPQPEGQRQGQLLRMARHDLYVTVHKGLRNRLPYYAHLLRLALMPSARDRTFLPLPDSLSALYLLVRPLRLIRDLSLRLIRHSRSHPSP